MARREVAILFADDVVRSYLAEVAASKLRGNSGDCQVSFPVRFRIKAKVVLIAYRGAVEFVAGIVGDSRADDIRWGFTLRSVTGLNNPLELNRLKAVLKAPQRNPLDVQGLLTERASEPVIGVLVEHQRDLGLLLDELFAVTNLDLPAERRALFAQERDGIASLFGFTGFPGLLPEDGFLPQSEVDDLPNRDSFLPQTQGRVPLEDPMVEHDANTFLGWAPSNSDRLGMRTYTDGADRKLKVMSVNRWPIETRLGPDLIYYHEQRRSFVLVQYKRMTRENGTWRYKVNAHFREQLKTMRDLDDRCLQAGGDDQFRLLSTPSFVKICRLDDLDIDNLSMVSGMCLPRKQVEAHLARPGATQTFDYDVVRDYMTSTLFATLVANGYLGSSGASSNLVNQEIDNALNRGGSVLVGAFSDTSGQRPTWRGSGNRRRRTESLETGDIQ